ncbi:glycosyltransferase family 1 protein [Priestia filamentosa]|uniref:glycosyltransferase family 1 protein n=1 Tax=Priestia filamentosa TaxID=1402861 RepID=UPI002895F119|nr:glycosyltransferase family 1 protein [Priestia filamentosa]MDT3766196.1 glycosyltransferase family 1 protein [Priestia filamentosa]
MNRGGLETLIMNIYRNIDRSRIQFDFLVHREEQGAFDDEIISLGGRIHKVPYVTQVGHFAYVRALNNFFVTHPEYQIVHSHMNAMSGLILKSAKKKGVPIRIAHSHSAKYGNSIPEKTYKKFVSLSIPLVSTQFFSCSQLAGDSLFGKKVANNKMVIIKNGVDLKRFAFRKEIRNKIRKELKVHEDTHIVGHVGRFQQMKNHDFLVDVFAKFHRKNPNSVLLLVGDGDLRQTVEQKVRDLKLGQAVHFLGTRSDVHEVMQAFDVLLFPSLYEGLPVTLVEAQALGIKCVISDCITKEIDLGLELVKFISLNEPLSAWVEEVAKRDYLNNSHEKIIQNGYDIRTTSNWLQNFYYEEISGLE